MRSSKRHVPRWSEREDAELVALLHELGNVMQAAACFSRLRPRHSVRAVELRAYAHQRRARSSPESRRAAVHQAVLELERTLRLHCPPGRALERVLAPLGELSERAQRLLC